VAVRYPFTYKVSDPGGVVGIKLLSDSIVVDGMTKGDAIPSSNGFLAVLLPVDIVDSSSAIPVFEAL
jgi:hypothetical protein